MIAEAFVLIAAVFVVVIPFYPARTYVDLVGQSFGQNRFGFAITNDGRRFYYGDEQGFTGDGGDKARLMAMLRAA